MKTVSKLLKSINPIIKQGFANKMVKEIKISTVFSKSNN